MTSDFVIKLGERQIVVSSPYYNSTLTFHTFRSHSYNHLSRMLTNAFQKTVLVHKGINPLSQKQQTLLPPLTPFHAYLLPSQLEP